MIPFSCLLGQTLVAVTLNKEREEIVFANDRGESFRLWHDQDCCENVIVESIVGELKDLIGTSILLAEEITSSDSAPSSQMRGEDESFTWTFYKLGTIKGYVDIRWFGSSNGFYSERVSFEQVADMWLLREHAPKN